MVRLTNQLYYSVFGRSYMYRNNILIGRSGVLYERGYVGAHCTADREPDTARLSALAARIADLRAKLLARNVTVVFLVTPSKAAVLPEFLPGGACPAAADLDTARHALTTLLRDRDIPVVDGHELAVLAKARDPLPPFPPGGTHWSRLVGGRAAAALVAALDRASGQDFGDATVGDPSWTAPATGSDADLANLLNLFRPPIDYPTGLARLDCRQTDLGQHRGLIAIGGSFVGQVLDALAVCGLFGRMDYYFYYTDLHLAWPGGISPVERERIDWRKEFAGAGVVLLELNERAIGGNHAHLDRFLDDALGALQ